MKWTDENVISGERLQALADVTIATPPILAFHRSLRQSGVDNVLVFNGSHRDIEPAQDLIAKLRGYRSIFVYTHLLLSFVERVLPFLDHQFVLISHNSDDCVDARFSPLLDDTRLVHWYAQNAVLDHAKLTPLPIGIANLQWPHGQASELVAVDPVPASTRHDVVYCNFDVRTNPAVRAPLLRRLADLPFIWTAPSRPFRQYLTDMAQCGWCISPPGNGVDCHRTWEALYLGVVPIVQRTAWGHKLHDLLPVVQVDDFAELTPGFLAAQREYLSNRQFDFSPLSMDYWRERISGKIEQI